MAMHKPRKIKRFQDGGYLLDSEGNPVRDGSNQPIMTGYGREEAETQKRMQAAEAKLANEVQEMVKPKAPAVSTPQSNKANDGDVDERDRRLESAANMPARMPTRPGQGDAMAKPRPYKKDYKEQKERFLKENNVRSSSDAGKKTAAPSRARATPSGSAPKQTMGGTYRDEGRGRPAPTAPEKRPGTALPINPGILKQREADEKKRDAARAAKRKENEAKEEKFTKDLRSDPGQMAIRKEREAAKSMSPSERSAARGRAVKEFFGINTKKPLDAKGATIQSMDTDMMRTAGRTAAKEQGQKRKVESSYKKGGSVSSASKRADGIAQRGKTRGKVY
jgi:hypothetical protein